MPSFDIGVIVLLGITFFAAFVNGALGYGFSSLTVPVALVFYTNRILNPALVLIEVFINLSVLFINRTRVPGRSRIDSRGRVEPDRHGVLPPRPVRGGKPEHLPDDYSGRHRWDSAWRLPYSATRRRDVSPHLHEL